MEEGIGCQRHECAHEHGGAVVPQHRGNAHRLQFVALEQRAELLRDDESQPCEQCDDVDREGDEEGIAPPPREEVARRQARQEEGEQRRGENEAEGCAELRHHRVPAALVCGRVQREQGGEAVPGAAEADALDEAHAAEEVDGERAGFLVARKKCDGRRRGPQDEHCHRQLHAASVLPVDSHEDRGTDRTGNEGQGEDREGIERGRHRVGHGEEKLGEYDHRGDGIDEEIEEFRGAPDDDADGDAAGIDGAPDMRGARVALKPRRRKIGVLLTGCVHVLPLSCRRSGEADHFPQKWDEYEPGCAMRQIAPRAFRENGGSATSLSQKRDDMAGESR